MSKTIKVGNINFKAVKHFIYELAKIIKVKKEPKIGRLESLRKNTYLQTTLSRSVLNGKMMMKIKTRSREIQR